MAESHVNAAVLGVLTSVSIGRTAVWYEQAKEPRNFELE